MPSAKRRRASAAPAGPAPSSTRAESGKPRLSKWHARVVPIVVVVLVIAAAWVGADRLARRAKAGAAFLVLADLATVPEPARAQIRDAAARAAASPESSDATGELGRALHASLLSEDAITAYDKAEQIEGSSWRWPYLRAVLLEERSRLDDARTALQSAIGRDGAPGLAWFRLAEIAFKQGRLDDASAAYRRAVEMPAADPFRPAGVTSRRVVPLGAYAQLGLARIALDRQQVPQAAALIDAILAGQATFGPARSLRASLDAQSAAAAPASSRAYVPPNDPEIDSIVAMSAMRDLLLKHAAVAARGGDREWREFLVRRAAEFNPRDPNVLMELAAMFQATNRATEALDVLRRHEQLVPGDHHTLVEQGRCLADLGRLEEAEAVLRRAARVRDAAAEYNLGTVVDRLGRSNEARSHYEKALAIDPFHSRALNNLGVLLDRRGQGAEAIRLLERAIQADPENADAYSNLGSALIGARRLPEALRAIDVAVGLDPDAANPHNNRGIALAQSGRVQEAVAEWNTALRLDPAHLNARRNLEQVLRLAR